ncbi:MAG: hypothetical protein LC799_01280 [Actinobacteria bacterium]|nr:hypothetical protein [Actinomycetota bacterium]
MIREDRELLAELARLNTDTAALGLRIMEDSASAAEQAHYAERLIAAGERLRRRADGMAVAVVEGGVGEGYEAPLVLPPIRWSLSSLTAGHERCVGNEVSAAL